MAIEGLTQQQSDFVERFLKVPKVFNRKAAKARRREAAEQFRLFNAEFNEVRAQIAALDDAALQSVMMAQLRAAEHAIERDPKNLDFDAGHAQLAQVEVAVALHNRKAEATEAHARLSEALAAWEKDHPPVAQQSNADAQSDIALTWTYIEDKLASGTATNNLDEIEAAIRGMTRLEGMLETATSAAKDPFETRVDALGNVKRSAEEGLDPRVLDARRRLSDVFNQLQALRDKLAVQFGAEKIPLDLRMECTSTQTKLDTAMNATPGDLPDLAEDAEDNFAAANKAATAVIDAARLWDRDHDAFKVRYEVMLAHPAAAADLVVPEFEKVTTAYNIAREKAAAHKYLEASQDIGVIRHDLKDALDFADDYANFHAVLEERRKLLQTLPDPNSYPIPQLKTDHDDALDLLVQAEDAYDLGQISGALALLTQIPKAVADILEAHRFAKNFVEMRRHFKSWLKEINSNATAKIGPLIAAEIAYAESERDAAQTDAEQNALRRASGRMSSATEFLVSLSAKVDLILDYHVESSAFTARRRETRARKGPEGRIAIEAYYQDLLADDGKRKTAEASGDYKLAHAMCVRLKNQHADMMALADDAKKYLVQVTHFDAALAKLQNATSVDAKEARDTAELMQMNAVAATARGNWMAAASLLENANLEIARAVSDAEAAAVIDGHQGALKLTSDTEFSTIYESFAKILAHVSALDDKGAYAKQLKAADTKARSAEAMMEKDLAGAEATLNEAADACRAVALQISAAASYIAQLDTTNAVLTSARAIGADGVIDEKLDAADKLVKTAKKAAKTQDFSAALASLAQAQALAHLGLDTMATYTDHIKDTRKAMKNAIAAFRDPAVSPNLDTEAERLQAVLDAMNGAFNSGNLSEAVARAGEGVALADTSAGVCKACKKAVDIIDNYLIGHDGIEKNHVTTVSDMAELKTLTDAAVEAMGRTNFKVAYRLALQAYWLRENARQKAERFDLYLPQKVRCQNRLDALEARTNVDAGPGHTAVEALRKKFDGAVAQEALDNYSGAAKRLDGFEAACDLAAEKLDAFDRYILHRTKAQEALSELQALGSDAIETLLKRLENKDRNALAKGQAFEFDIATSLYIELKNECLLAANTAGAAADFVSITEVIKDLAQGDDQDLLAAIAQASQTLKSLQTRPAALYVHEDMATCRTSLDQAERMADDAFDAARDKVEEVMDMCVRMTLMIAQYEQLDEASGVAKRLAQDQLKRGVEADFARSEISGRVQTVDVAMFAARQSPSNRAQTHLDVEAAIAALRDLRRIIDAQEAYLKHRLDIEAELMRLEKSQQRHLVRDDLVATRKLLDTAATHANDRKHSAAEKTLKSAALQLEVAEMRGQLADNKTPKPADVKALLDAPGGMKLLDDIIDTLEASVQRDVMAVVFEARYGCVLEVQKPSDVQTDADGNPVPVPEDQMGLPAVNLRRFYKEMQKLPQDNTLDNDSMLTFSAMSGEQTGSAYDPGKKQVLMREGDEASSRIYAIAVAHEIGELDPSAVPKPGEERTAFSWNTLHEVGHAVDDKLGYMKKHGERLAGWKVYGANVKEPASEIAKAFDFDADYVAEYMMSSAGRKLPMPQPVGCGPGEWQRRMEECRNFVDRARSGNNPWNSASVAAACVVGNYTYVESYEGDWARYRTAERKFAVSGYQFRAPGEWFSELYAAMASDRLNSNHPHRDEIAALCMKEGA
ncbi:hypothetical protein Z946_149 [Sulfitobacter noctilucicola]|uniref:Uncharacterized protein n=1 Tax=Sulfitobacter noctilucicola TaxID=1342301 RepID=A0A7W6MC23_9RHOB|nr:hypothetical protein [Sulfitobacter noctilucicola]KIN70010.1 hypothetical protein Z946_149 [Sulfitobacter noctilucicola]MBB4176022.1 hypothetical protein [Sulfitobacter noctilucicola]